MFSSIDTIVANDGQQQQQQQDNPLKVEKKPENIQQSTRNGPIPSDKVTQPDKISSLNIEAIASASSASNMPNAELASALAAAASLAVAKITAEGKNANVSKKKDVKEEKSKEDGEKQPKVKASGTLFNASKLVASMSIPKVPLDSNMKTLHHMAVC